MTPFSIYFPQFYPTSTNDRVWGRGFTDWVLLANHNIREPVANRRAPARGLYDGADPAIHRAQLDEMRAHGLGGVALYHYWFFSHQELDRFEQSLLTDNDSLTFPWFLIWATEGWTKRWLGDHTSIVDLNPDPTDVQIEQHCRHLAHCFSRFAYYRWQNRPLFVIYNLAHFANPARVLDRYRSALLRLGYEVAIANFIKNAGDVELSSLTDASYVFEPRMFFNFGRRDRGKAARFAFDRTASLLGRDNANRVLVSLERAKRSESRIHSADDFVSYMASNQRADLVGRITTEVQEVISPGWNNAPRYGRRFTALEDLSAQQFSALVATAAARGSLPPLINAWNEWTEKAAIEPCTYIGTRYLDALQSSVD